MGTRRLAMILGVALCLSGFVPARSEGIEPGNPPIMKPMLVATEAEVIQFDQRGEIVWRTPSGVARDVWQRENGNVLFPFNQEGSCGVREVALSGETVWEYKLPGQYVISCQRLKNGNTLVGASCRGAVLVVNPQGEIVHSIKLRATHGKHSATIARQLDNGHVLVVEESTRFVAEYALNGVLVWEVETPFRPFGAQRLKTGNTLISGQTGLIEVTPKKNVVWRLASEDVKEMGPRWFAGFRILPNGNIMVCNAGGVVPFFEVNRQKQVVWHAGLTKQQVDIAHGFFLLSGKRCGASSGQNP